MDPLLQQILHAQRADLRMLAAPLQVRRGERPHERDAVVPEPHELHPQAQAYARAVVALARDRLLIPRDQRSGCDHVADPARETAPLGLDEVPYALVHAPLTGSEMPLRALIAERVDLAFDERAGGLEQRGDLRLRQRSAHEMSCGALRIGTWTLSTTVPSGRVSCCDSPCSRSRRSLRRRPDCSSPSGGSSLPSLCSRISSLSSFQVIPRTRSLAVAFSMRSTSESWMSRKIATSSSDGSRRSRPDDEVAIFRLIQNSLVERIEKATAKDLVLGMTWKDDKLEILLQSDGKELPP